MQVGVILFGSNGDIWSQILFVVYKETIFFCTFPVFITLKLPSSPAARPPKIFFTLTKNISAGTGCGGQAATSQTQVNGQLMGNGANNNHNINRQKSFENKNVSSLEVKVIYTFQCQKKTIKYTELSDKR